MDYITKTVKGEGRDGRENGRGTKSQRGGEVRREWNGEGALGGLFFEFLPRGPEFQVTPLQSIRHRRTGTSFQRGRGQSKNGFYQKLTCFNRLYTYQCKLERIGLVFRPEGISLRYERVT